MQLPITWAVALSRGERPGLRDRQKSIARQCKGPNSRRQDAQGADTPLRRGASGHAGQVWRLLTGGGNSAVALSVLLRRAADGQRI